jgi:hypothetical protein
MSYYQEGHNGTVKKISECSNPFQILYSLSSLFGRIYPIIGFQRFGSQAKLDISNHRSDISSRCHVPEAWQAAQVRHIDPRSDICIQLDILGPHRVLEAW